MQQELQLKLQTLKFLIIRSINYPARKFGKEYLINLF